MKILKILLPLLTVALCGMGLLQALRADPLWPWLGALQGLFFGTIAPVTLVFSIAVSIWCLLEVIKHYRTLHGYPWLFAFCFAAAATVAILALQVLSSR